MCPARLLLTQESKKYFPSELFFKLLQCIRKCIVICIALLVVTLFSLSNIIEYLHLVNRMEDVQ